MGRIDPSSGTSSRPTGQSLEQLFAPNLDKVLSLLKNENSAEISAEMKEYLVEISRLIATNELYSSEEKCLLVLFKALSDIRQVGLEFEKNCSVLRTDSERKSGGVAWLSISGLETARKIIDFVAALGVHPAISIYPSAVKSVSRESADRRSSPRCMLACLRLLLACQKVERIWSLILQSQLSTVLAGLVQLAYSGLVSERLVLADDDVETKILEDDLGEVLNSERSQLTKAETQECLTSLNHLVDHLYQPLVIRTLLTVQRLVFQRMKQLFPCVEKKEVTKYCQVLGRLLTGRLMAHHGVEHTVRSVLDDLLAAEGGEHSDQAEWSRCQALAHLLASTPSSIDRSDYIRHVCGELCRLLETCSREGSAESKFIWQIVMQTVILLHDKDSTLTQKYFFNRFLAPLKLCSQVKASSAAEGQIISAEGHLEIAVQFMLKMLTSSPPGLTTSVPVKFTFLKCLLSEFEVIFEMFATIRASVSFMRSISCQALTALLKSLSADESADCLHRWLIQDRLPLLFQLGNSGGVMACYKPRSKLEALVRVESVLEAISELIDDASKDVVGHFYLLCIQGLNSCEDKDDPSILAKRLKYLSILSSIAEKHESVLEENKEQALHFLKSALESIVHKLEQTDDVAEVTLETASLVFTIISFHCTDENYSKEKTVFAELLPLLEQFERLCQHETLREVAFGLRSTIATHGAVPLDPSSIRRVGGAGREGNRDKPMVEEMSSSASSLEAVLREIADPLVAVQGHGLIVLKSLVLARKDAVLERKEAVLKVLEEKLTHEDSYVYLAAINALTALVDTCAREMVHFVTVRYQQTGLPAEVRLRLGEVLVKVSRSLGELAPDHRDAILVACLRGCKDEDAAIRASSMSNLGEICKVLQFALGPVIHEVMECITALIKTDPSCDVRRAAVMALTLVLRGLNEHSLKMLNEDLTRVYRTVKQACNAERDDATRIHLHLTLEEIDRIMKSMLFPARKMEFKIQILGE